MLRTPASLNGYLTSTWAGLPAAASAQGQIVRVTDVGVAGVGLLVISDGTRWAPLGPQVLARSAVSASVTGTLSETTLATLTVPGGLMGVSGGLRIVTLMSRTSNANAVVPKVKLGGTIVGSYAPASVSGYQTLVIVRNRASAASQASQGLNQPGIGLTNGTVVTSIDTSVDQPLTITSTLGVTTDTSALDSYTVEILP